MIEFYQEAAQLQPLSKSSLYAKFNQETSLTAHVIDEIKNASTSIVKPDDIKEIISLIRLNGDAIAKKATDAYMSGEIVIINNKETSKIPASLPYIIMGTKTGNRAYVFANVVVDNINSSQQFSRLMTTLESAYIALKMTQDPKRFLMNRDLMLTLCWIYTMMMIAPLETKLYMKNENLEKASLYMIMYFYRLYDQERFNPDTINFKKLVNFKVDKGTIREISTDIMSMQRLDFMELLKFIIKINPVRYKDLPAVYLRYFNSSCGIALLFAIENLTYLPLLITSAIYKTPITVYSLNRVVGVNAKKAMQQITTMLA